MMRTLHKKILNITCLDRTRKIQGVVLNAINYQNYEKTEILITEIL
jgi:hypothetical protein